MGYITLHTTKAYAGELDVSHTFLWEKLGASSSK
jgi:hypothetical protein